MAATPSIKVTKTFTYRGAPRTWSNRYHFNGGTPADSGHWTTFANAVVAAEALVLPASTEIILVTGYAAGSDVPVFTKTYSTTGSLVTTGGTACPGDCTALVRYSTAARTPKNHPVYLFNYYHAVYWSGAPDTLFSGQKSVLQTYAGDWVSPGFSDGTNSYLRAGPNGASATGELVDAVVTHRDFPR